MKTAQKRFTVGDRVWVAAHEYETSEGERKQAPRSAGIVLKRYKPTQKTPLVTYMVRDISDQRIYFYHTELLSPRS